MAKTKKEKKTGLTLEIPKEPRDGMQLYKVIQLTGDGFDISDRDFDWGTYISCEKDWESCGDWYDRFCLLLCLNLTCLHYQESWYSDCDVADFIVANIGAFRRFCNENNKKEYAPDYYFKETGKEPDPKEDGPFYDVYMNTMESLLIGNYSDEDYHKLFVYLTGKEEIK